MSQAEFEVLGVGNAISDLLTRVEDDLLDAEGLVKGSMSLIDAERAAALNAKMRAPVHCSGGSAANTMVGIASLGGRAAYVGKVHDDDLGRDYVEDIRKAGVHFATAPSTGGAPTGRCLILVTPDGQRTMQTFLGAAAELGPGDIDRATVESAATLYLEGYLWDPPAAKQAFLDAARVAHAAGRQVSMSLSDAFCVDRHRTDLLEFVTEHVDILFANETEIVSLFEADGFESAADAIRGRVTQAALTRDARGSVVVTASETVAVAAGAVESVVDTTGAGDLYAAGFLFGLARGRGPAECARLGGLAAAEIISHVGARPRVPLASLLG